MGDPKKTIFLDRDGVINPLVETQGVDISPQNVEEFEFLSGVKDALEHAKDAGFRLIVFTNQPDVEKDWRTLDRERLAEINDELYNAGVDAVYTCTHGPRGGKENKHYREDGEIVVCDCRKPQPGLIEQASEDFQIDFPESYMIGDNSKDIEAVKNYEERNGVEFAARLGIGELENADRTFDNLCTAIDWITGDSF